MVGESEGGMLTFLDFAHMFFLLHSLWQALFKYVGVHVGFPRVKQIHILPETRKTTTVKVAIFDLISPSGEPISNFKRLLDKPKPSINDCKRAFRSMDQNDD